MTMPLYGGHDAPPRPRFPQLARYLLAPIPLAVLQPILHFAARHVAISRPELFVRLGPHLNKRFLIDAVELPFVLLLVANPANYSLRAYRRHQQPSYNAGISGTFLDLFDMIDGSLDGDALLFNRALRITGDVEAVVALRNALDDSDGNIIDMIVGALGRCRLLRPSECDQRQKSFRPQFHDSRIR